MQQQIRPGGRLLCRAHSSPHCHRPQHTQQQQQQQQQQQPAAPAPWLMLMSDSGRRMGSAALAIAAAAALAISPLQAQPAVAADTVKVGTCLLQRCQLQLAECLGDANCLQNIVCLNLCNNATSPEEEAGCQIRCGDLYGDSAVDTFNACAVSEKKCVPQRADAGQYPVPPDCALDTAFDLGNFNGRWFITAGQNPLFDTFDCQEHFFAVPEPGKLAAKINWRINKPNGDFIERSTLQTFVQVPETPALLLNHGNEYLHYQDDWYIVASKPDTYVVIYYKGSNDAWDGYGGAVVYTKARQLPEELVPELSAAVEKVGLKWADFTITDNSCKPHPPPKSVIKELEDEAVVLEAGLEGELRSFGKGFTTLEGRLGRELDEEEKALAELLAKVERKVAMEEMLLQDELRQGVGAAVDRVLGLFRRQ